MNFVCINLTCIFIFHNNVSIENVRANARLTAQVSTARATNTKLVNATTTRVQPHLQPLKPLGRQPGPIGLDGPVALERAGKGSEQGSESVQSAQPG